VHATTSDFASSVEMMLESCVSSIADSLTTKALSSWAAAMNCVPLNTVNPDDVLKFDSILEHDKTAKVPMLPAAVGLSAANCGTSSSTLET
jgi:hypothetical protein